MRERTFDACHAFVGGVVFAKPYLSNSMTKLYNFFSKKTSMTRTTDKPNFSLIGMEKVNSIQSKKNDITHATT